MTVTLRARGTDSLSLEEMQQRLPTIFATAPHQSRSDRYVYISTTEMLDHLRQHAFVPVEARAAGSNDEDRRNFAKHTIRLRQAGIDAPRVGDTTFEVILRNAHDGTSSYQALAGLFRLVLNGMAVGNYLAPPIRVVHTGDRERQLDQVTASVRAVLDQAPQVMEQVTAWKAIELRPEQQRTYAEEAHTIRFADSEGAVHTPIPPEQLLHPRRSADTGSSLWLTFQRVQENTIRGGLSVQFRDPSTRRWRTVSTREVRNIDRDIAINKALWNLTARTAERLAA
jgi:hypothetical protein